MRLERALARTLLLQGERKDVEGWEVWNRVWFEACWWCFAFFRTPKWEGTFLNLDFLKSVVCCWISVRLRESF